MNVEKLGLKGAWLFTPEIHKDTRGDFYEWFKADLIKEVSDLQFDISQANFSESNFGVIRGMHYSLSKLGQAKYLTCTAGKIRDIILDIRINSKTFGRHIVVDLDSKFRKSVLIPSGLAHGFLSLANNSRVCYLQTSNFDPDYEFSIFPLDPSLQIEWNFPAESMIISDRDRNSPTFKTLKEQNLLPELVMNDLKDK